MSKEEVIKKIEDIREVILIHTDTILQNFTFLLGEDHKSHLKEYADDINKIHEGTKLLKNEILRFLNQKALEKIVNDQEFASHLTKARHDLRNPINVMKGYTEILIEDLGKVEKMKPCLDKFIENQQLIVQILNTIDEIKYQTPQTEPKLTGNTQSIQNIATTNGLHAENHGNDKDFKDFKENFSILIVDDMKDNCAILERYLNRLGYKNIRSVTDGFQALAISKRFDLILLDIDMPGINGIEVLKQLREDISQRKLMVLMITAADTLENVVQCIKLGAEDFLTKPFKPELLEVRVDSCMEKAWFTFKENTFRQKIEFEKRRYGDLLHSVFPPSVVKELAETGHVQTRSYQNVGILFADVVSFTPFCDTHELDEVIKNLEEFTDMCERISNQTNLQKIKTIGDCFLGVSGMLIPSQNSVLDCIHCAKEFIRETEKLTSKWKLHIGISYGPAIGGIVGKRQYLYDVWGDTVNTAARVQSITEPNTIYLSKHAWEQVEKLCKGKSLGEIQMKGKSPLEIFIFEDFIS